MILRTLMVLLVLLSFSLNSASAQSSKRRKAKGVKQQTLDFEDELVEGATQKPELFYLLQKRNFNYKRLIKLRKNFLPEMRRTSEKVQRSGGGN